DIGHDDRVVDCTLGHIRLSDDHDPRAAFGLEQALHPGKFGGLISGDLCSFQIATGVELEDAGKETHDHTKRYEHATIVEVTPVQQIIGAQAGHHERAGD